MKTVTHRKSRTVSRRYLGSGAPQPSKVTLINLGCARNLVDSQVILDVLKHKGHPIVDLQSADIAIVNTCSFIEEARRESIDIILDLIDLKHQGRIKKVIVAGCLAQRYGERLIPELKGIDALVGTLALDKDTFVRDVSLTPGHFAYVKICESCYNRCSFCAIPSIKGRFVSRPMESILEETRHLDERGVKEINLVGQDITAYGIDRYKSFALAALLKKMAAQTNYIRWIRLLYAFPAHVTDDLVDVIAEESKICKYLDIPLQHISDPILRSMNRGMFQEGTTALIAKIKRRIPDIALRTTFIVGYPGETEKDFRELVDFVRRTRFHRMGAFQYSKEEGTPAQELPGQVPAEVKKRRMDILMREQQLISRSVLSGYVARTLPVLIDEKQKGKEDIMIGRTQYDAPEVDGVVYVHSANGLEPGDLCEVEIADALVYDLVARTKENRDK